METPRLDPLTTADSSGGPLSAVAWLNPRTLLTGGSQAVRVWELHVFEEKAAKDKKAPPPKYLLKEASTGEHVLGVYSLAVQDGGERAFGFPGARARAPPLFHHPRARAHGSSLPPHSLPPFLVFCSAGLGDIILWKSEGCKRLASLRCGHLEALGLSWRPADALLAGGSHSGAVNFFRVAESEEAEGALSLALSHTVRSGGGGGSGAAALATAFSRDGARCAAAHADGSVSVVDVDARAVVARLAPLGAALPLRGVAFFGDGARLATGGDDARVCLRWAAGAAGASSSSSSAAAAAAGGAAAPAPEPVFAGHGGFVTGVAAAPEGRALLASVSADRCALLWDPTQRAAVGVLEGVHSDRANCVAFAPDGTMLATVSESGNVVVCRVPQ